MVKVCEGRSVHFMPARKQKKREEKKEVGPLYFLQEHVSNDLTFSW
jgi:hypothetical protein